MKALKTFLALYLIALTSVFYGQGNVLNLTKSVGDTIWAQEENVFEVRKTTTGSTLVYYNETGDKVSTAIRERTDDTANVASTIVITFAGASGSVDSITINGVEIMGGSVAFTTNIGTTIGLVEDSIDNTVTTPVNYAASNVGAVLTISAPAAFGDTANGYVVVVYTTAITSTFATNNQMAGGFTAVRNILTMSRRIFNIESGEKALNADRIQTMKKTASGTSIWYRGASNNVYKTTDVPSEITAAVKAL
jgi:hypothetical protein